MYLIIYIFYEYFWCPSIGLNKWKSLVFNKLPPSLINRIEAIIHALCEAGKTQKESAVGMGLSQTAVLKITRQIC